jgi:Phytanoyl-CoA dioxygenase (PhyH)
MLRAEHTRRILTDEEVASFLDQGYLAVDREVVPFELLDLVSTDLSERPPARSGQPTDEWLGVLGTTGGKKLMPLVEHCRAIAAQLLDVRSVACHFDHGLSKPPRQGTTIDWHQDRASSKTPLFMHAVHLWVPLQDTDETNGCMRFVPGSHYWPLFKHRTLAPGRHQAIGNFDSRAVSCPVRKGGFTAHTPMTMHGSGDNLSDTARVAWVVQFGTSLAARAREHVGPLRSARMAQRY